MSDKKYHHRNGVIEALNAARDAHRKLEIARSWLPECYTVNRSPGAQVDIDLVDRAMDRLDAAMSAMAELLHNLIEGGK